MRICALNVDYNQCQYTDAAGAASRRCANGRKKRQAHRLHHHESHMRRECAKIDKKLMTSHRYADITINMYALRALSQCIVPWMLEYRSVIIAPSRASGGAVGRRGAA